MKIKLVFLFAFLFALMPITVMAQQELDFKEPSSIVLWLTPIITLGATWLIKKVAPLITGTVTLIVVPLLAAAITWLTSIITGDANWTAQILAGIGSVFINQLYRKVSEPEPVN